MISDSAWRPAHPAMHWNHAEKLAAMHALSHARAHAPIAAAAPPARAYFCSGTIMSGS